MEFVDRVRKGAGFRFLEEGLGAGRGETILAFRVEGLVRALIKLSIPGIQYQLYPNRANQLIHGPKPERSVPAG